MGLLDYPDGHILSDSESPGTRSGDLSRAGYGLLFRQGIYRRIHPPYPIGWNDDHPRRDPPSEQDPSRQYIRSNRLDRAYHYFYCDRNRPFCPCYCDMAWSRKCFRSDLSRAGYGLLFRQGIYRRIHPPYPIGWNDDHPRRDPPSEQDPSRQYIRSNRLDRAYHYFYCDRNRPFCPCYCDMAGSRKCFTFRPDNILYHAAFPCVYRLYRLRRPEKIALSAQIDVRM